jgi:hypothetical protein
MGIMLKVKPGKIFVVLGLVLCLGSHWGILQCVAWSTMLVRFASSLPLIQAIQYTFDGEHPCTLCKSIQEGSAQEKQTDRHLPSSTDKVELLGLVWQEAFCVYPSRHLLVPPSDFLIFPRGEEPPTPVPRSLLPGLQATCI